MTFRILKLAAAAMIAVGFVITLWWPSDRVNVWAQLPAPNPLLAPVPPPAAPPQLAAPVTVEAAPSLIAVPTPATPAPTPSEQTFNCSCFGPGMPTAWMGQVVSSSYFNAQQAAEGACVAYNERAPSQPAIPSIAEQGALPSLPESALPVDAASDQGQQLPNTIFSSQNAVTSCQRCSCS
ncbi:MAG TPA: hypothetical protein VMU41_13225 [Candidatus Binataceae bacterium]|nr:hypothetical protein [Candidatus Binataceae bacterium]